MVLKVAIRCPSVDGVLRALIQLKHLFLQFKFTLIQHSLPKANQIHHMLKFGYMSSKLFAESESRETAVADN